MDEIKVGDRRRWKGEDHRPLHTITHVSDWGVAYATDDGLNVPALRPHYDDATEPVPTAPTFERGDVVQHFDRQLYVVTEVRENNVVLLDRHGNTCHSRGTPTPTGHKVPTIDEGQRYVIWRGGEMTPTPSRKYADRDLCAIRDAVATIRDGRIVTPVTVDGVEHLVPVLSGVRS